MKILMLISSYHPELGGAEVFAQEMAERSIREGNEVDVITGLWDKKLNRVETINGVNVHRVKVFKGKHPMKYVFNLSYIFSAAVKALELDKLRNYDLIHSIMEASGGIVGTVVKKFRNKPHLVTMQGGFFLENASLFRRVIVGKSAKWCFKNADMVHGISNHLVEERAKKYGAKAAVVIPNGVDVQGFRPMKKQELRAKSGFSQDEKIILSICPGIFGGSLSTSPEGYPSLIESVAALSGDFPDLHLITIGEGYKRDIFKAQARELGIEDKVSFLGTIPHEELPGYLAMADVFIRPRTVEGQGISYVEAMACGIPVIGANVGGTVDVVEHGKNGLLVSPLSVNEISAALRLILEDGTTRQRFIAEGLKTVEEKFRWEAVFDKINQIYMNLAEGRSGEQN